MRFHESESDRSSRLISISSWREQIGRSDTTVWRWCKAGWLHPINIGGRNYLDISDIRQFEQRAKSGSLTKSPSGAAKNKSEANSVETDCQDVDPTRGQDCG